MKDAGERRWLDKIQIIPVIVRSDLTNELRILLAQIAENIHRQNMNLQIVCSHEPTKHGRYLIGALLAWCTPAL